MSGVSYFNKKTKSGRITKPARPSNSKIPNNAARKPPARDEEISSDSDESMQDQDDEAVDLDSYTSSGEDEVETEADKRRRLAKQYLENLELEAEQELGDGFDAKDLDRELLIARRLKEDVAENRGRIYRNLNIISDLGKNRIHTVECYALTSIATHYPFAYTTSKDLCITKWDITKNVKRIKYRRGNRHKKADFQNYMGHFDEIMCIAVSPDGKYVATGGKDRRIVIWSNDLLPIKVFETKDKKGIVTGLAFRRGTNELYASCQDLKVRTYNLDSMAQVEILFGHQDMVQDISALGQDRCLTVGSRDRTAIIWKINEETRLTFRGAAKKNQSVVEGSIDCCSMIEDQLFVTGSDNGSISLWSLQKKKPLHVLPLAHGFDKPLAPNEASAEQDLSKIVIPHALPRQITCIYAIPYSNIFFSGSNNSGDIKVWKLSTDHKKFELLSSIEGVNGIVNRISVMEQPKNKSYIVAAVSKEMRLGRWLKLKHAKNGIFVKEISINSSY